MQKRSDTIAAICTPIGRSGIGIVRISGPSSFQIANQIVQPQKPINQPERFENRKMIHAYLIDSRNQKIDEVLVSFMPQHKSFTGEPTVEINCHGGKAILLMTLKIVLEAGARAAEPGEFTRRAFENGRINLVQAEAINELINAHTDKAVKAAWRQIEGGLTTRCEELKEKLKFILSTIQGAIDFDLEDVNINEIEKWILEVEDNINQILEASEKNKYISQGCWVVLSGSPNVGKSSIFNEILKMERSIVCDIPGTTRDHISEIIELEGIEIRLTDTAGIRKTNDKIESCSIEKSMQQMKAADIIIYVLDYQQEIGQDDLNNIKDILDHNGMIALNKCDLTPSESVKKVIDMFSSNRSFYVLSVLTKKGMDDFLNGIAEKITDTIGYEENPITVNIRQFNLLKKAKESLVNSLAFLKTKQLDLSSHEIIIVKNSVKEIIGEIDNDDVLTSIFTRFCVGK